MKLHQDYSEKLFNEQHNSLKTSSLHSYFIYYTKYLVHFLVEYGLFQTSTYGFII